MIMSQYLTRVPLSRAIGQYCYYCNRYLQDGNRSGVQCPYVKTRDHILPKCRGTFPIFKKGIAIGIIRSSCADCNRFRGYLNHCSGALMMAIIEGQRRGTNMREAAARVLDLYPQYGRPTSKQRHLEWILNKKQQTKAMRELKRIKTNSFDDPSST
jgi:hypothetical protein